MIIFDASTLILVAKVELLETFLATIGQPVAIPRKVEQECCGASKFLDALLIRRAVEGRTLSVVPVSDRKLCSRIRADFGLGHGEAEAVVLALAGKGRILAIDDKLGINACKVLQIPFTTAIGILVEMHDRKFVGRNDALVRLGALEKYGRYSAQIMNNARSRLEGKING